MDRTGTDPHNNPVAPPVEQKVHKKKQVAPSRTVLNTKALTSLQTFALEHRHFARLGKKKRTNYMKYGAPDDYLEHLGEFADNLNKNQIDITPEFRQKCIKKRSRLFKAASTQARKVKQFLRSPAGAGVCHMLAREAVTWMDQANTSTTHRK